MRKIMAIAAAANLSACASTPQPAGAEPPLSWAGIGEAVYVDGPRIKPVRLLEDSRCPANVHCAWAGTVRIAVEFGGKQERIELELGEPVGAADGSLELVEVRPEASAANPVELGDYRFGLRFMGGL